MRRVCKGGKQKELKTICEFLRFSVFVAGVFPNKKRNPLLATKSQKH